MKKFNPLDATGQVVWLAGQLENARHFAIYFVHFSSCKTTPLWGSWKHPHKYQRKVKAFIFQGLPCLLQAVIKIRIIYKFHKGALQSMALAILRDETELEFGSKRVNGLKVEIWLIDSCKDCQYGIPEQIYFLVMKSKGNFILVHHTNAFWSN